VGEDSHATVEGQEIRGVKLRSLPGRIQAIMGPARVGQVDARHVMMGKPPGYESAQGASFQRRGTERLAPRSGPRKGILLHSRTPLEDPGRVGRQLPAGQPTTQPAE